MRDRLQAVLLVMVLMAPLAVRAQEGAAAAGDGSPIGPDEARPGYSATTTRPADVPLEELKLLLKPLTVAELRLEANAWLALLQAKVAEISKHQIAVRKQNIQVEIVEGAVSAAEETRDAMSRAEEAGAGGEAAGESEQKKQELQEAVEKARAEMAGTLADEEVRAAVEEARETAGVAPPPAGGRQFDLESREGVEAALEAADELLDQRSEIKSTLLDELSDLHAQRTVLLDRLQVVLDEFAAKGGEVESYEAYMAAVSGVEIDVSDTSAAWATVMGWVTSAEGGRRWLWNIVKFLVILAAFWLLSRVLSGLTDRAVGRSARISKLLREFIGTSVRWLCLGLGAIIAISALEVDISPLLAAMGGAAFVIAFALQGTLSNFASGILILFYRPFDVGDIVESGAISGHIDSMSLVSTHIRSFDNKLMIVPNNTIWNDVIINATGSTERRVDLVFGIGYGDDIGKAQKVMREVVEAHPKVLEEPEPTVEVFELGDSSVNFVCRPWVRPKDYWNVYWDITRGVKEAFDANGITIPFPQRDVHHYPTEPGEARGRHPGGDGEPAAEADGRA